MGIIFTIIGIVSEALALSGCSYNGIIHGFVEYIKTKRQHKLLKG